MECGRDRGNESTKSNKIAVQKRMRQEDAVTSAKCERVVTVNVAING